MVRDWSNDFIKSRLRERGGSNSWKDGVLGVSFFLHCKLKLQNKKKKKKGKKINSEKRN